jgi:hypothetical protein
MVIPSLLGLKCGRLVRRPVPQKAQSVLTLVDEHPTQFEDSQRVLLSHRSFSLLGRPTHFQAIQLPSEVAFQEPKLGATERNLPSQSIVSTQLVRPKISDQDLPTGLERPELQQNLFHSGLMKILFDKI